jgi:hypothetical protein
VSVYILCCILCCREEVSVYMVVMQEDGTFCVQREDSSIFQIAEDIEIVAEVRISITFTFHCMNR